MASLTQYELEREKRIADNKRKMAVSARSPGAVPVHCVATQCTR